MTLDPHTQAALRRYARAAAWRDSAAIIADDALYQVVAAIASGRISVREAQRHTGVSKSHLARLADKVRMGQGLAELTPHVDPEVYETIHEMALGERAEAPFVRDADTGVVSWR